MSDKDNFLYLSGEAKKLIERRLATIELPRGNTLDLDASWNIELNWNSAWNEAFRVLKSVNHWNLKRSIFKFRDFFFM